jgi:hypothetical protein
MTDIPSLVAIRAAATAKTLANAEFTRAKRASEEARNRQAVAGKASTEADVAFTAALDAFVADLFNLKG